MAVAGNLPLNVNILGTFDDNDLLKSITFGFGGLSQLGKK